MRQLYTMVSSAVRLLGISIVFCVLSGQAQAEVQNSISALSVSYRQWGDGHQGRIGTTTGKSSNRVYDQYPSTYRI